MNTGIIMIGLSLVLLSVGLISSPASAALPDGGCGSIILVPDSPHGTAGTRTVETSGTPDLPITGSGTMTSAHGMLNRSCDGPGSTMPRTGTNVDHTSTS